MSDPNNSKGAAIYVEIPTYLTQRRENYHVVTIVAQALIVSDRDIRRHSGKVDKTTIGVIMSPNPICISPDDSINEAVRMLLSYKIGGLPVTSGDKLVGIITTTDILRTVLGFSELD